MTRHKSLSGINSKDPTSKMFYGFVICIIITIIISFTAYIKSYYQVNHRYKLENFSNNICFRNNTYEKYVDEYGNNRIRLVRTGCDIVICDNGLLYYGVSIKSGHVFDNILELDTNKPLKCK